MRRMRLRSATHRVEDVVKLDRNHARVGGQVLRRGVGDGVRVVIVPLVGAVGLGVPHVSVLQGKTASFVQKVITPRRVIATIRRLRCLVRFCRYGTTVSELQPCSYSEYTKQYLSSQSRA